MTTDVVGMPDAEAGGCWPGAGEYAINATIKSVRLDTLGHAELKAALTLEVTPGSGPPPPFSPLLGGSSSATCTYRLPGQLIGTFSTAGEALVTGAVTSKKSKCAAAPTLTTSFTARVYALKSGEPNLLTSLG
jgi:hypothetical protein